MLGKILYSFKCALKGLKTTWQEEHNFRIEILIGLVVVFCVVYFKFSFVESALAIIAITIVLTAEVVNTVIEDLCNKVQPEYDKVIGKIKDTMAGFVLVSVLGAVILGLVVFLHHFLV